jgi:hypothetical protein
MKLLRIAIAFGCAFGAVGVAAPALAATHEFSGRVLHVSTDKDVSAALLTVNREGLASHLGRPRSR